MISFAGRVFITYSICVLVIGIFRLFMSSRHNLGKLHVFKNLSSSFRVSNLYVCMYACSNFWWFSVRLWCLLLYFSFHLWFYWLGLPKPFLSQCVGPIVYQFCVFFFSTISLTDLMYLLNFNFAYFFSNYNYYFLSTNFGFGFLLFFRILGIHC